MGEAKRYYVDPDSWQIFDSASPPDTNALTQDAIVDRLNAFAGVDDPAALMAAVRDYCDICKKLSEWDGGNILPDGYIEAKIQSEFVLSRLRAAMSEVE